MSNIFHKDLRNLLVHATSWSAYWKILEEEKIRPNRGDYKPSLARFPNYYCKELGAISLLNMSVVEEAYAKEADVDSDWAHVFSLRKPITMLLALASVNLKQNLKSPEPGGGVFIDPGEVCHVGEISVAEITRVFVCLNETLVTEVTSIMRSKDGIVAAANALRLRRHQAFRAHAAVYYALEDDSVALSVAELDEA